MLAIINIVSISVTVLSISANSCDSCTNQTDYNYDDKQIATLRQEMVDLFKLSAEFGWDEGIDGHLSAAIGNDLMLINRFGSNWGAIIDSDIITVNINTFEILSEAIDRDMDTPGKGLIGWRAAIWMNSEFHKLQFPNISIVFHLHSPYIRIIGCSGDKLKMIDQNSLRFKNRIIYYNYSGIIVDRNKSMNLVNIYKNENNEIFSKDIIFMRNHGVLILANNIASAFNTAYFLEIAAKTQIDAIMYANAAGTKVITIDNEIQNKTMKKFQGWAQNVFAKHNFEGWRRRYSLKRTC